MTDPGPGHDSLEQRLGVPSLAELAAPSSLLSSRWTRDNLITSHPARLYDGRVLEAIDQDTLEELVQELVALRGPVRFGEGRMGVFTWDIACEDAAGAFVLQIPRALDEPGRRGRARRDVPRQSFDNTRRLLARGLTRFLVPPRELVTLRGEVPAALLGASPEYLPLGFGSGSLQLRLAGGSTLPLGPSATAELLVEMIAALVYHYDPDTGGGAAITDVFINDDDFLVRRRSDGSFALRLSTARRIEAGIGPTRLLLYLLQLMAYQDFAVDGSLTGLPVLVSNPSVAFEGVVRGLGYRYRDCGRAEADGVAQARRWLTELARSSEGRAYRPWVEQFLSGRLPPRFGEDPRERWWRSLPLQKRQHLLELRGRLESDPTVAESARALGRFLERLSSEVGRGPADGHGLVPLNELGRDAVLSLLAEARVPCELAETVAGQVLSGWPYTGLDQLLARVPAAHGLRRMKARLWFGRVIAEEALPTSKSFGSPPKQPRRRPLANPELFSAFGFPAQLAEQAVRAFPSFETYMEAALHDESWGYYGHRVVIGGAGHFDTHPEELSPLFGRWVAARAFAAFCDLLDHGELTQAEPFFVIELGAGNGRLARDFLDAVPHLPAARPPDVERLRLFGERVDYRIYERSSALRARQRSLLGTRATVSEGDARHPAAALQRDFPDGVRGVVVTNELPDAFGVHKLVLTADGDAFAALVVPRVEAALAQALSEALVEQIATCDAALRSRFSFLGNPDDRYLDGETFAAVLRELSVLAPERRDALLSALWFEEGYVPVGALPELAAHLADNAEQYATALAAEDSGVVLYVNLHAARFVRELGSSLRAGFVVTIDYGDTTWGLVRGARRGDFPFRVYGEWLDYVPRPNDPYAAPGSQDLTADVNFTELARAGSDAGLTLVHYGPERDIAGDELAEVARLAASEPALAKFLANPVFKLLVLGTRPSAAFSGSSSTPLPLLCRAEDVPPAQRERIAVITERLRKRGRPER